jgi:hypothetical protein
MVRSMLDTPGQTAIASDRRFPTSLVIRVVVAAGPALLIGVLAWPMLFTNAELGGDWINHLWYMWNQSMALRVNHHPSLFLNYSHSVLYPEYAFYSGTIYVIAGALSLLFGDAPIETYVLTYLIGFAASYGGWYWLAYMAGLRRWQAHAPAVIFITSAYYLMLIYARGDWPEFLAVSTIPLLIAAGLDIMRADRLHIWPALALAGSSIVFFGSHNITMVWGSTVIALVGAGAVLWIPETRGWLAPRRVIRIIGLILPSLLVNAWFLLPAIVYQSHTEISIYLPHWIAVMKAYMFTVSAQHIFTLLRTSALPPNRSFTLALPVLVFAWALVGLVIFLLRSPRTAWTKMLLICAALTVLMTIVMTHAALISALPRPYAMVQFSYRLESYVLLGISGTVLALLVLAGTDSSHIRIWAWTLVPILIFSIIGAIQQTTTTTLTGNRSVGVNPRSKPGASEPGLGDYSDFYLPELTNTKGRTLETDFPVDTVHDDRASTVVHIRPGELVYSNIGGGPELVNVVGARIVGIDPVGNDVLEIGRDVSGSKRVFASSDRSPSTETISVSPANGVPVVLGRALSLGAIIFLVGEFTILAGRRIWPIRRPAYPDRPQTASGELGR